MQFLSFVVLLFQLGQFALGCLNGVHEVKDLLDVAFLASKVELQLACLVDNGDVEFESSVVDGSIGLFDVLDFNVVD